MFEPFVEAFNRRGVLLVLASGSPRRREILQMALPRISLVVMPSDAEENLPKEAYGNEPSLLPCWKYSEDTAALKARDVMAKIVRSRRRQPAEHQRDPPTSSSSSSPPSEVDDAREVVVVGCDTIVTLDGEIFGKPSDRDDAKAMLRRLSGRSHTVYSGVCMIRRKFGPSSSGDDDDADDDDKSETDETLFHEATQVEFDRLTDDVVEGYVATGEPDDKAGSYGIQALGGTLIKGISGDYYNVVGLPLNSLCRALVQLVGKT